MSRSYKQYKDLKMSIIFLIIKFYDTNWQRRIYFRAQP